VNKIEKLVVLALVVVALIFLLTTVTNFAHVGMPTVPDRSSDE
jgi:hypothetical protein